MKQTTEGVNVPNSDKIEGLNKYQRESDETAAVIDSSDRNNTGEGFNHRRNHPLISLTFQLNLDHLSAELFRT